MSVTLHFLLSFNTHYSGVSEEEQMRRINNQVERVTEILELAKLDPPRWTIVVGHYPVFSWGDHGDNNELVKYLSPLLDNYQVDAYLSGHDRKLMSNISCQLLTH